MPELKSMRPEDEISLEDFLRALKSYIRVFMDYWKVFLLSIVLCTGILWFWNYNKPPTYQAKLTLMLSDDGGQSITGISSILGQFGLPISSGKYNIDKLLEIARSRHILENVLLEHVEIDGNNQSIADHIIEQYELNSTWEKILATTYKGPFSKELNNEEYNYGIKQLQSLVNGNDQEGGLLEMEYGRDHYIMTFKFESISEDLSVHYLNSHFENLRKFYIDKAVEKQKSSYDIIKAKRDSIYFNLETVENELAQLRDRNQNSFRNSSATKLSKLSTQSLILKTAFAKAEENLAIADLALQNNTPLIQLIDSPIKPIAPNQLSNLRLLILGVLSGLFLTLVVMTTLYLIRL